MFGIGAVLFGDVTFGLVDAPQELGLAGPEALDLARHHRQIRPHLRLVETTTSSLERGAGDRVRIDAV